MELTETLDRFELKVRQLGSKLDRLRRENEELQSENKQLKAEVDRGKGAIDSLKDKLERTHQGVGSTAEAPVATGAPGQEVREQIDHYLREIDKCIEWLEQR
jgi:predicted nuclease with TOPRIM domain